MSLQQIEQAVRELKPQDLKAFRDWFAEYDAANWDQQIEEDEAAGRLDHLADEAIRHFREGR